MQTFSDIKTSLEQFVTYTRKRFRILDIAVLDTVLTLLAVYAFSVYFNFSFWYTLVIAFIIMVVSHRIFHARSTTDKWLFPNG